MAEKEYLTVSEALQLVLDGVDVLSSETVPLLEALDRVLAQSVVARDSLPPFANSSMDGYAVRAADVQGASREKPVTLRVVGDVAAGSVPVTTLGKDGQTVRIMTGAPLPDGADAVIPVEETSEPWRERERPLPDEIDVYRSVDSGDYVRYPGEDVEAGEEVLPPGHVLRPQEISVLASLGVAEVEVVRRPRVAILATGDELIPVNEPLQPGKIRNSNGYAQTAQVKALGAIPVPLGIARDTEEDVRGRLQAGLDAGMDLFVSSAGVSVGAYDVVKAVLEDEGNVGFWRVRMRPGKPLAFGTYAGIPYLGLPGNPVSSMVSFERFARPAILKMAGHEELERPQVTVTMRDDIYSDGRETYARAVVERGPDGGYVATTTGSQGSHIMTSLVKANALVIVPEGVKHVPAGDRLLAMMIDWPPTVF
ncbi:MAG: molybdopterin molybdotransferase MoeA [Candidatus Promineifilaceae bacterium]|nr:molybdopterin molybdotransferase MoeA [Candidatus Promineifilaceae bacterium]